MRFVCRLILLFVFVASTAWLSVFAQQTTNVRDSVHEDELTVAAKSFLFAWLVKRDVRNAMLIVAAKPVLAKKCDLQRNIRKVPSSAKLRRNIVRQILSSGLKVIPKYTALNSAIGPTEIPEADWLQIKATSEFQILRIKPGEDGYLMCKFEENKEYRRALLRSNVRYIGFKLKNIKDCPDLENWISAWAKENGKWTLISIGLLED